ncbi:3-hydroxyisobutyryl-CoA hydrolase-like protein 1, mitochondrial isoform X1 [Ricinus communis]|uniref:3-hydroxyisobutyryl-CoA hydrolase-like protein 1, mitochondrial isoform X1 n=1 Tax=Ricinus communis TaxID=3988 RepID=UPI00201AEB14|nr:3-hydroxyisobutyryl-CoA hydrolase-like protein 1, mitochondrial isoform X1 [Ricinus communis]
MQCLKFLNRPVRQAPFTFLKRSLCSLKNSGHDEDLDNLVQVEERSNSRTVILNRPHVLNALTTPMGVRLTELYQSWEKDPLVGFVVLKGNGRAFCAGGDVVKLYQLITEGRLEECKDCFRTFYSFMYLLGTYLKPHVAILDGITMGGGAGLSVHGSHRVATEKTVFGVPEILIGLHPDAGASYYLPRLPGYLGEYLGLTADRISGEEMVACGLATQFLSSARLPFLEEQFVKFSRNDFAAMGNFLDRFSNTVGRLNQTSVIHRIDLINECFGHDTVEEILHALETEAAATKDEWCISTLKRLREAPPLSLKISLRSIREGRFQTLEQCLAREYLMTLQAICGQISKDFCEGVQVRLVDKSFAPKWDPPSLEQVSEDMVDAYFAPLNAYEPGLELPTNLREAFA